MRRHKSLSRQELGDLRSLAREVDMKSFEYTFATDDGSSSVAVYIPRFTIPKGVGWESGEFPGDDLHLGGFWFDKYQCSHKAATDSSRGIGTGPTITPGSTTDVAVSQYRKVVWTDIDWYNAKTAIENRYTDGRKWHMVTMREWVTICFLARWLVGSNLRGNNFWGRDYRDPDSPEYYGELDPVQPGYSGYAISRVLAGTGPDTWFHNGKKNGIWGIVGNVYQWNDFLITDGVWDNNGTPVCVIPTGCVAYLDGAIGTDDPVTITYKNLLNGPGAAGFAVGRIVQIDVEIMTVTDVGENTITVSRGTSGSSVVAHSDSTAIAMPGVGMVLTSPTSAPYYYAWFKKLRADYADLALPSDVSGSGEWLDRTYWRLNAIRAARRGGCWSNGSLARSGLILLLNYGPANRDYDIGLRAALADEDLESGS